MEDRHTPTLEVTGHWLDQPMTREGRNMREEISLAGTPAASPLGYYSWAFGQAARDPFTSWSSSTSFSPISVM